MKRFFAVLFVLVMNVLAVYPAGLLFGVKLGAGFGAYGNGKDMEDIIDFVKGYTQDEYDSVPLVDEKSGVPLAFALYGGYYFTDRFALQTELGFTFGQKKTWKVKARESPKGAETMQGTYHSLDIPLLARFDFVNRPALFGIGAGPYLSVTLGNIRFSSTPRLAPFLYMPRRLLPGNVTAGMVWGLYGGCPLGPGRIIADARVIMAFNALKGYARSVAVELFKRWEINITAGYEILLGEK